MANVKFYKHYKGGIYKLLSTATHTETGAILMIYESEDGKVWARPFDMFFGYVNIDGRKVGRFTLID